MAKLGIQQTTEALDAALHLAKRIIEIKKKGMSGLNDLLALYTEVKTGIEGGDQIPAEMKDLDPEEMEALLKRSLIGSAGIMEALGAQNYQPYALFAAEVLEAGKTSYTAFLPVVDRWKQMQALRAAPKAE